MLKYTKSLSVVVVPSINLITQFNKDYLLDETKKEYNKTYYNLIKSYINELKYMIIKDEYLETNRWFYLHIINNN